jgi:hypothetical protein
MALILGVGPGKCGNFRFFFFTYAIPPSALESTKQAKRQTVQINNKAKRPGPTPKIKAIIY